MRDYASDLPVFLDLDLYEAGWNGSIIPYPGIPPKQMAMQSLKKALVKKFSDGNDPKANAKALELFLKINSNCKEYSFDATNLTELDSVAIGEAKEFIFRFFYPDWDIHGETFSGPILSLGSISDGFGVGNGSNIGSYGTDFLSKVGTSLMSATTPKLSELFRQAILSDPLWSDVESIRSKTRGSEIVRGSRLSFVPKTTEISRTICTEPLLNMLFQKGIDSVLRLRLRQVCGIDLKTQQGKNRVLAQLGSKNGKFGTIDLSSASDSMSLSLVREFFPPSVVRWLELTRSPVTTLPGGTEVELHMVSSMGNAFTFPLQTLFFFSLVYGSYRSRSIKIEKPYRDSLGNFAVYGDDIIVLNEAYDHIVHLLSICGFSVNVDKSFNQGFFRESCGGDYYLGHNIRGVYIQGINDVCDVYSAINRLNVWSAKHQVCLHHTVSYLMKGSRLLTIPFHEQDIAGVKVPLRSHKAYKRNKHTGGNFYRYVYITSCKASVVDVETRPPKLRGWFNNHPAVLMAALAGTLRDGKVVSRANRRSFRIKSRYSSSWDYILDDQGHYDPEFGERWKSFVEFNLNLN